jgi:putative ABC transport system permease protein
MIDILTEAWRGFIRWPIRTLAPAFGMMVGIGALVALVSTEGTWQRATQKSFMGAGFDRVEVVGPRRDVKLRRRDLTVEDAQALRRECDALKQVAWATIGPHADTYVRGQKPSGAFLYGVSESYAKVQGWGIRTGRRFTPEDYAQRARVCALTPMAARRIAGTDQAAGQQVRVNGVDLAIVAVLQVPSEVEVDYDGLIVVPDVLVPQVARGEKSGLAITALARDFASVGEAHRQINRLLSARLGARGKAEFCYSDHQRLQDLLAARGRIRIFIAAAVALMLATAGLGITTVLLVAVADRSRELGAKRALGATARRLRAEVMTEGAFIALAGAFGGIVLGLALTFVLWQCLTGVQDSAFLMNQGELRDALALPAGFFPSISWQALLLAVVMALLTSLAASAVAASAVDRVAPSALMRAASRVRAGVAVPLTVLQGALGIAVALVLVSLFQGLGKEELRQIRQGMETDRISVWPRGVHADKQLAMDVGATASARAQALFMSEGEVKALAAEMPEVLRVAARLPINKPGVSYRGKAAKNGSASAVTSAYFAAFRYRHGTLGEGRLPTAQEFALGARVCVLDKATRAELFGSRPAVGQQVRIAGVPFTVLGVLDKDSQCFPGGSAFFPVRAALRSWVAGEGSAPSIVFQLRDERHYAEAAAQIRRALYPRLGLKPGEEPFMYIPAQEAHDAMVQISHLSVRAAIPGLLAVWIAAVGLLNLLLIAVHEDINEVGLRRALGATGGVIARSYLWRGLRLAVGSGVLGIGVGALAAYLLGLASGIPALVPARWMLFSAGILTAAGTGATLLPAAVASRVHPAEALRYE